MINYFYFVEQRSRELFHFQLHELSNKYNLLSLTIEETLETFKKGSLKKADSDNVLELLSQFKCNFSEYLIDSKRKVVSENCSIINTVEASTIINKIKLKTFRDKKIVFNLNSEKEGFPYLSFLTLVWNRTTLHAQNHEDCKLTLHFNSVDQMKQEDHELSNGFTQEGDQFKENYLNELTFLSEKLFS